MSNAAALPTSLKLSGCLMSLSALAVGKSDELVTSLLWAEKQGTVDVPLPTSDKKSRLQTLIRSTNTSPSLLSRVKLQFVIRVLQYLFSKGSYPSEASPLSTVPQFSREIKLMLLSEFVIFSAIRSRELVFKNSSLNACFWTLIKRWQSEQDKRYHFSPNSEPNC
jgi:hypothetical protein